MAVRTISKTIDLSQLVDGRGIDYITEWYQISNSDTTPPATPTAAGTGYSITPMAPTDTYPYLWSYEVVYYTIGAPEVGAARVIGSKGTSGSTPYIQNGYWYINGTSTGVKAQGEDGQGSLWYYGVGITGDDIQGSIFPYSGVQLANVGDMYLNTSTSAIYQCTTSGAPSTAVWVYANTLSDSVDMSSIVINQRQVEGLQEQLQSKADLVDWINSNEDARAALSRLSDVQDVLGILGWVSEYGTYSATTDISIDKNKAYYILDSVTGQYNRVTIPSSTYIADMYEQDVEYEYFNTLDTSINPNKTYYTYDSVNDVFVVVVSPQQEDLKTYFERETITSYTLTQDSSAVSGKTYYRYDGATNTYVAATPTSTIGAYYELNLSDSIKDYLLSHISISNGQMSVINDNTSYYLTMSPTALEVRNAAGATIASYGSQIALGNAASGIRNIISSTRISFNTSTGDVAYFGLNSDNIWEMHIDTASVDDMMFFGDFAWIKRDNGNLSLKWMGN